MCGTRSVCPANSVVAPQRLPEAKKTTEKEAGIGCKVVTSPCPCVRVCRPVASHIPAHGSQNRRKPPSSQLQTSPHLAFFIGITCAFSLHANIATRLGSPMQPQYTPPPHDWSPMPLRMMVETGAAILTALSIAPVVAIVDKAIVSNASGRQALLPCVVSEFKVLMSSPLLFLKQPNFLLIWGVYRCCCGAPKHQLAFCM